MEDQDQSERRPPAGRLADMVGGPDDTGGQPAISRETVVKIAVLAGLWCALNFWQFRLLGGAWLNDLNWSHGFIIPLFSLFLLYNRRRELLAARQRVCVWALPLMILALLAQMVSFHPIGNHWLCQLSMVAVLFFLVLYLAGPEVIGLTWLPIWYLALAMPLPQHYYTRIALPLQEIAAVGSAGILRIFGVSIEVTASHLKLISTSGIPRELTVAEACSGMRSLMAYVALGIAWAYLEERALWQRVILVLAIVPVAVFCNVIRVTITCGAYALDRPELGRDFMHTFTGMLMLAPALALFLLLSWTLKHLFVEEPVRKRPVQRWTPPKPPEEGDK